MLFSQNENSTLLFQERDQYKYAGLCTVPEDTQVTSLLLGELEDTWRTVGRIELVRYVLRCFPCFSPLCTNFNVYSMHMQIKLRWRFQYFRLYNLSIYLFMTVFWWCPCWEHREREIASKILHFQKHFSYSEILWCHNFCDKLCCAFPAEGAEGLEEQGCISFWLLQVLYWSNFMVKYT